MLVFAIVIQSWIEKEYMLSVTFAQATMKVSLRVAQAAFFWRLLKVLEGTAIVKISPRDNSYVAPGL